MCKTGRSELHCSERAIYFSRQSFAYLATTNSTIHKVGDQKVGNRWVKALRRTIASALADWEFVQCWMFRLPRAESLLVNTVA
ncbi:MAG: hypothetical protein LBU34_07225 [Planctomycetaceae bacterium]|nr:hypothetical protein [Planctomycetaceae bacterium]